MVSTEEIVERSVYMNILAVALKSGHTIDPDDYLDNGLPTIETEKRYKRSTKNNFRATRVLSW